jgi:hypothetical protein
MKKRSIHVGVALLLALAFVFIACEGPAGPGGPKGEDLTGLPGGSEYFGLTLPGIAIDATALEAAFAASDVVTVLDVTGALDLEGVVPAGKTLKIAATAASIDTDDLLVEAGGAVIVLKGAALIALNGQNLTVESGATVTVRAGGALGVGDTGIAADAAPPTANLILAKRIGGLTYDATANIYGTITFDTGSAFYTKTVGDIAADKGYKVASNIYLDAALTTFDSGVAALVTTGRSLTVVGAITTLSDGVIGGSVTATGAITTISAATLTGNIKAASVGTSPSALAISGTVEITGALASVANALTVTGSLKAGSYTTTAVTTHIIAGNGPVEFGAVTVTATSGNANTLTISASNVKAGTVGITSNNNAAADLGSIIISGGKLTISGTATLTKDIQEPILKGDVNGGTLAFKEGATLAQGAAATVPAGLTYKAFTEDTTYTWDNDGSTWE